MCCDNTANIPTRKISICSVNHAGAWALKMSLMSPSFFLYFQDIRKKWLSEATDLAVSQLLGSTMVVIPAHVPGLHMWASAGPRTSSSSPKQWKSDSHLKIYNFVRKRSQWLLIKSKKKKLRRVQQYKSLRVSALTGSVPRKMAKGCKQFQHPLRNSENWTQVARLTGNCLNHWAMSLYEIISIIQKNWLWLVISSNLEPLFCLQDHDCYFQIAQIKYQGQAQYTRILEHKPLIDAS